MRYSSDKYVEQVAGAASVTEIFNKWGETYFRDYEVSVKEIKSTLISVVVSSSLRLLLKDFNISLISLTLYFFYFVFFFSHFLVSTFSTNLLFLGN